MCALLTILDGGDFYDPAASALFAAMTVQPDETRKSLYNNLIVGLKTAGIWGKLDALWITRAHDQQAATLNLKNPAVKALIPVNSPVFTANDKWATNGTTSYLDTNWNPVTDGVNYTRDNASLFLWNTATANQNGSFGWIDGSGAIVLGRSSSNDFLIRVQDAATVPVVGGITNAAGFIAASRLVGTTSGARGYKNGALMGTGGGTTSPILSGTFKVGRTSSTGYVLTDCLAAGMGAGLSDAEHLALYNSLNAYMSAVGPL